MTIRDVKKFLPTPDPPTQSLKMLLHLGRQPNVLTFEIVLFSADKWRLKIDSETINTQGWYVGKEMIFMCQNRS